MTPTERKERPVYTGVLAYFPDALLEVALVSKRGNDQHNPGQPLHWAKEKSTDHPDCIARHLLTAGTRDSDGMRHTAKIAWRALALLQTEIEAERKIEGVRAIMAQDEPRSPGEAPILGSRCVSLPLGFGAQPCRDPKCACRQVPPVKPPQAVPQADGDDGSLSKDYNCHVRRDVDPPRAAYGPSPYGPCPFCAQRHPISEHT